MAIHAVRVTNPAVLREQDRTVKSEAPVGRSNRKPSFFYDMNTFFRTFSALAVLLVMAMPAVAQQFGGAVAVSGDDVIVGMSGQNSTNSSVHVFRKGDDGSWMQAELVAASDNNGEDDRFGRSLAADGRTLAVGATLMDNSTGGVYIFQKNNNGAWVESQKLLGDDTQEGDSFGRTIALDGDWLVVGAAGADGQLGAAYVFRRGADGMWAQHTKLAPEGRPEQGFFGLSVAASDGNVLVAAPMAGDDNNGDVYVFYYHADQDAFVAHGTLGKFPGVFDASQFGLGLDARDGMVVVGAPQLAGGIGGAAVYRGQAGNFQLAGLLLPFSVAQPGTGSAVKIVGQDVWVGGAGSVYVYSGGENGYESASFLADGDATGGTSMAVSEGLAVVGNAGASNGLGTAHVLAWNEEGWVVEQSLETAYKDLFESMTGGEVRCEDGEASQFPCQDVDMLSFLNISDLGGGRGVRMNDVWGWTDPETGREYAVVGRNNGTSFVDVTDPYNPRYLGDLPMTEGANAAAWRDMKVYNNHTFIVADGSGQHGMQVFDLTRLRDVTEPQMFEADAHYGEIGSAHNIVINEDTGYAYAVGVNSGGETCGGGLHMINIQDPLNPTFVGCFGHEGTGNAGTGYSHDAQCLVYNGPDSDYAGREICFGSNETALSIADVTDKSNPVAISTGDYPNAGYTHQGWISEDFAYYYVNDELDEMQGTTSKTRTMIWDITDLDEPVLVKEHLGTVGSSDHNLYIKGNLMYQSNYNSGLRVLDISDPENPVEVAYFDVAPQADDNTAGFNGTWSNYPYFQSGTLVVTGIESGLFLLKKRQVDL